MKKPKKTALRDLEFGVIELAECFAIDQRTLRARLVAAGHGGARATVRAAYESLAGPNTLEALRASRIALQDAQKRLADQKLAERDAELLDLHDFLAHVSPRVARMLTIIESSKLTEAEKYDLRDQLSAVMSASTPPTKP